MKSVFESLQYFFEHASKEEQEEVFESVKEWSEVGPTVEEYLEYLKKEKIPNENDV